MFDFLDKFFGKGSTPVRRELQIRLRQDANGNPIVEPIGAKSTSLSGTSSIDGVEVFPDRFHHCGCNAQQPIGGKCGEPGCANVSCAACFGRCTSCLSPCCLEHTRYLADDKGVNVRLCPRCFAEAKRIRIYKSVAKGLLSPIIEFDSKAGDK
jgi:hypothetical protein